MQTFHPMHRDLLAQLQPSSRNPPASPSAICVPTARPPAQKRSGVGFAARLARDSGCPLVLLASKNAATRASVTAMREAVVAACPTGAPATLVLHLAPRPTRKTHFEVDDLEISKAYRRGGTAGDASRVGASDLGRKRNVCLLLARSMGWRSVLFLDDDVFDQIDGRGVRHDPHERPLDARTLGDAVSAVESGRHAAVAWALRGYDDNSVLCRIRGMVGEVQGQFVGGGALLVDTEADLPFFPAIYNEDWFFFLRLLGAGRETALLDGGDVHQDPYEPFLPTRAASEELGDLIAEGLFSLLHGGGPDVLASGSSWSFWEDAIASRIAMREHLERKIDTVMPAERDEMHKALDAVKAVHERFLLESESWIAQIRTFVEVWQRDLVSWRRRVYRDAPPRPIAFLGGGEFVTRHTSVMGPVDDVDGFVGAFSRR